MLKRNGKGKGYWDNKILFEGEYLNGKKFNGKGKEYVGGKLNFEYEMSNGEIRKGKERI